MIKNYLKEIYSNQICTKLNENQKKCSSFFDLNIVDKLKVHGAKKTLFVLNDNPEYS